MRRRKAGRSNAIDFILVYRLERVADSGDGFWRQSFEVAVNLCLAARLIAAKARAVISTTLFIGKSNHRPAKPRTQE